MTTPHPAGQGARIRRFVDGQRVTVVVSEDERMHGRIGVVVRRRAGDNGAWLNMHDDLPSGVAVFPEGDTRFRHFLAYPEDCESTP